MVNNNFRPWILDGYPVINPSNGSSIDDGQCCTIQSVSLPMEEAIEKYSAGQDIGGEYLDEEPQSDGCYFGELHGSAKSACMFKTVNSNVNGNVAFFDERRMLTDVSNFGNGIQNNLNLISDFHSLSDYECEIVRPFHNTYIWNLAYRLSDALNQSGAEALRNVETIKRLLYTYPYIGDNSMINEKLLSECSPGYVYSYNIDNGDCINNSLYINFIDKEKPTNGRNDFHIQWMGKPFKMVGERSRLAAGLREFIQENEKSEELYSSKNRIDEKIAKHINREWRDICQKNGISPETAVRKLKISHRKLKITPPFQISVLNTTVVSANSYVKR